jgi:hypothetical protein
MFLGGEQLSSSRRYRDSAFLFHLISATSIHPQKKKKDYHICSIKILVLKQMSLLASPYNVCNQIARV